ncbi:MAG: cupin domain-containing protein [Oscillospiraceae bacterium]|nr:cupin domain-containing protein [Oscillospiraceae bacterium]
MQNFAFNAEIEAVSPDPGITRKILVHSENLMVCELHFEKGAVGKPHEHFHEQCSYVVSGAFEFQIDGVKKIVRAGDATYKQPHVIHGAVCLEEGVLLDIFCPERKDFLR